MIFDKFFSSAQSQAELLTGLVQEGKVMLAHQLQRELGGGVDLSVAVAEQANAGPPRTIIYEEMHAAFLRTGGSSFGAKQWLRYLCLAEFTGRIGDLGPGVRGALSWLSQNQSNLDGLSQSECVGGFELACALFDLPAMRAFSDRCHDSDKHKLWSEVMSAYEAAMWACGLDPNQPNRSVVQMAAANSVPLPRPSVLIRVKSDFWRKLSRGKLRTLKGRFDPILLADEVRIRNLDCLFVPQFSNAGPNFAAPYSQTDPNLIAVLGYHKYCYRPSPKLLNYRSYMKGRYLVDSGGYSGWIDMPPLHHIVAHIDHVEARAFCEVQREEVFGNFSRPPELPDSQPYVFIPLQLQNDSVTALAYTDPEGMIEACRRHFSPKGWAIVVKKHPKDTDHEIAALLSRLARCPDVIIADLPSPALVRHASAVALVNSSVGWEAVLAHKPILAFGRAEYHAVAQEIRCDVDLASAELTVNDELRRAQDALYYHFMTKQTVPTVAEAAKIIGANIQARLASSGLTGPGDRFSPI